MRESLLHLLCCPRCRAPLAVARADRRVGEHIMEGALRCSACAADHPIVGGIPRFVPAENYASSFGFQWKVHARSQYDAHTRLQLSGRRFFEETGWPADLTGETMLEVGSGSGRFTEHAAATGATLVSVDYSAAVEANYASNGGRDNLLIVQGDVYALPVRPDSFDRLFCFGMLQHTSDVRAAFMALPPLLRQGGSLVVDVYKKTFTATVLSTKYYVRPLTRRIDAERLYALVRAWIDMVWPVARVIGRVPRVGRSLNWRLLVADYSHWGLAGDVLKEWAYLDTFDMLSPRYDSPQTIGTLRSWFDEAGLVEVDVKYGYNGIEGRGRRPIAADAAAAHGAQRAVG